MKKFSNITGQKIGESPKIETKLNEKDLFKSKVINLMEQLLTIRTYGPVDRYQRAGNIKITGKEEFLNALMSMIDGQSLKEQQRLLENLKSDVKDWDIIDSKIDQVNSKILESKEKNKVLPYINNLISIYENYSGDEEMVLNMIDKSIDKIKKGETAYLRHITANHIISEGKYPIEIFKKISEKYLSKSIELGYEVN